MKKFLGLLTLVLFFSSCDDGEIVLESFDFGSAAIQKCSTNELLFKINNDELLLTDIPASFFPNEVTPVGQPRTVPVSSTTKIIYRKYNGAVTNNTICSVIPPASPMVTKEWNAAAGGTIEIITTEKTTQDPVSGAITVTGYNHLITFVNVQFVSSDNTFVFEEYIFGTYTTNL